MCRFPIFASKPINMKRPLMLMCAISICAALFAQPYSDREESFTLTRYAGHYMFTADINGTAPATIMLESGIPALLVDSAFAFGSGCFRDMHLEASDRSINLGGDKFRISHTANGTVRIGRGTSYRGKIWILSGYADHRNRTGMELDRHIDSVAQIPSGIVFFNDDDFAGSAGFNAALMVG